MSDSKHIFYDYIMLKSHPTFLFVFAAQCDLISMLCDKCKKNEVQIYNDCCDCCISCWYEMTDPIVS